MKWWPPTPWFAGRLVKTKTGAQLRHPVGPASEHIDSLFTATPAAGDAATTASPAAFQLAPTSLYAQICTKMYKSGTVVVGSGYALLGKDKPVVLLTLVESVPGKFALVFSMSHVVGDGRTYYEVFKMLQPDAIVRPMPTARVMAFSESMRDDCGRKELKWAGGLSAGVLFMISMIKSKKA